jgi:integrase
MSDSDSTTPPDAGKPAADHATTPASRRARLKPPLPPPKGSRPRPAKPSPDFPLFPHAAGVWAKKIRGKLHYFGPWEDPDAALAKYLEQKDALHAGRKPRLDPEGFTVKDAANAFLNAKRALLECGELSPHTWANYKRAADTLVAHMGKMRLVVDLDPQDFASLRNKMAKKWGPHRLAVTIQHIRSVLKYAFDAGLIAAPVRFGPGFKGPTKKTFRLHRAKQGAKMFSADELRRIIDAAGVPLRAMVLLGVNVGFGNSDCGNLPLSAVNLDTGWLDYPRPKTGIGRRCPLWPETVEAMRAALARRPDPKDEADAGRFFLTKYGGPWAKETPDSPITKEMRKLLDSLGVGGHRNFYALRHTFETVGGEAKDQVAVDHIMGHERQDMASLYREHVSDRRLKDVVDHVHAWLFPADPP